MSGLDAAGLLIQRHLDGLASTAEAQDLGRLLARSPTAADAFAEASRLDAALADHFADAQSARLAAAVMERAGVTPAGRVLRFDGRWLPWVAAAVLVLAGGGGLAFLARAPRTAGVVDALPPYAVVAGSVRVDGVDNGPLHDGAAVEVVGDEAAVLRLPDGSLAELAPASRVVIRGDRADGPVVVLTEGGGEFQLEATRGRLRVETPVGNVSARQTAFAVGLRQDQPAEEEPVGQAAMSLVVAVLAGNVDVRYGDQSYALTSGDPRVYASGKPARPRKPDFDGRVVAVGDDGQAITVEAGGRRRGVRLGDDARLAYVHVPLHRERPTVGYHAAVWLAAGSPDSAEAVTFSGKKAAERRPDLTGRVTAVSADGRRVTLHVPPRKKGESARSVRVTLRPDSKVAYALVPFYEQRPTVGYQAAVWLAAGSADATAVTFSGKKAANAKPDVTGRVTALSADGREITLRVSPRKEGEAPSTATFRIGEQTQVTYAGVKGRPRPEVGWVAAVWLVKGSKDQAAGVRFTVPAKKPARKAAAATEPAVSGFFALPKKIELTDQQRKQVAAVVADLTPALQELQAKRQSVLSAEQHAARAATQRAVRDAGLTDQRLVKEALEAATGVSAEQQERFKALAQQQKELRQRYFNRVRPLLTDEQRALLGGKKP